MRKLVGITAIPGGILLVLTPRFILPACEYEGFPRMHCSDTAEAEMVLGTLLFGLGFGALFLKSAASTIVAGSLGIAFSLAANVLPDKFGYCMSSRMPCNYGMVTAVRLIAVVAGLIMAAAVAVSARKALKKGKS